MANPNPVLHGHIKQLRRDMPRNVAVTTLCEIAEGLEKDLIAERKARLTDKGLLPMAPIKPLVELRTIDERVADCPVCTARRTKEAKKKQRQRVKKSIPGRRK